MAVKRPVLKPASVRAVSRRREGTPVAKGMATWRAAAAKRLSDWKKSA